MSEKSKLAFPQSASQMLESKLIERRAYYEAANQSAASHWQRQQSELTQAENSIREMDNALKSAVQSLQQRQQSTMVQVENSMRKMDNALKSAAQSLQQCQQSATAQAENSMREVNNALKSAAQSMNDAISSPFEKLNQQLREIEKAIPSLFTVDEEILKGRFLSLAKELYEAVKRNDKSEFERISQLPLFGIDLLHQMLILAKMSESQQSAIAEKGAAQIEEKYRKITNGYKDRQDQQDKATFIDWVKKNRVIVEKTAEIEKVPGFPLSRNYSFGTLKSWYKEAMPDVTLKAGRPKNVP